MENAQKLEEIKKLLGHNDSVVAKIHARIDNIIEEFNEDLRKNNILDDLDIPKEERNYNTLKSHVYGVEEFYFHLFLKDMKSIECLGFNETNDFIRELRELSDDFTYVNRQITNLKELLD